MKQIVISLVWLLFVAGCSTDHGDAENAATGSYVAKNGALDENGDGILDQWLCKFSANKN